MGAVRTDILEEDFFLTNDQYWQDKEAVDPGPKPVAIPVLKLHICPAMIYLELLSLLNHNTKCNY